jgi:predicted short-subunit dehydrogenase-like oxidoreductase (DUF2520 family)
MGRAAATALRASGYRVSGPTGRGEPVEPADVVLLCVPDREIEAAVRAVRASAGLIGHTSGATTLRDSGADFGLHPLRSFVGAEGPDAFRGIGCAVAGVTPEALSAAEELVAAVGGEAFTVTDEQRTGYHAAASIASNFLVTLAAAAEATAAAVGLDPADLRRHLVPLVHGTVDNWALHGPRAALTGPVARGDEVTVARQREAVRTGTPDELALFDILVARTRALAASEESTA